MVVDGGAVWQSATPFDRDACLWRIGGDLGGEVARGVVNRYAFPSGRALKWERRAGSRYAFVCLRAIILRRPSGW